MFDLELQKELYKIEAHDSEVLCLEYSNENVCGRTLLVSASRDRLIHIYDVHRQYSCIQNINDHSSSITSVKFVCDKLNPSILQMISCGADKSLIFRVQTDPDSEFRLDHRVSGKSTFYDMAVDSKKNQIIIASQDRQVRAYDVKTAKNTNSFKGSLGEDGALIKIAFDPSATFIATSCTDKSIYIFDYQTGECLATTSGHSEIVTGLKFSHDGRHLISISGDGCIFVWRLPVEMTNAIASKLGLPLISESCHTTTITNRNLNLPLNEPNYRNGNDIPIVNNNAYRFNVSTLPSWAKKQMIEDGENKSNDIEKESSKTLPRGRWAQRVIEENPSDLILSPGLVKSYANTFESLASRSTPSTPSGANSPTLKELKMNRLSTLSTPTRERAKSSLSSGVEDDDDDRNTTDSDNTYSHDSSYKVTKVSERNKTQKPYAKQHPYSMVTSISMANINDLPFDEEDLSVVENNKNKSDSKCYTSLYMSTENLEKIDQRNRYLKSVFENIDKNNFENNNNSASDDSGINQIDHSLSSSTTNSTLVSNAIMPHSLTPPNNLRQSLSSKFSKTQLPNKVNYSSSEADEANLSDNADHTQDQSESIDVSTSKFPVLDTIRETPNKEDCVNEAKSVDVNNSFDSNKTRSITSGTVPVVDSTVTILPCLSTATSNNTAVASASSNTINNTTSNGSSNDNATMMANQPSVSKKREELSKMINDAKKKLDSVSQVIFFPFYHIQHPQFDGFFFK